VTTKTTDWPGANTQHGVLVAFGEFLQQHGLIEGLMQVPVPQKTRRFSPQTKLVEFLAGIMSGMEHLEDLNMDAHPLTKDAVVAQTWGQAGFAHYSGVSRTLDACNAQTVEAVERVITDFSRPFIAAQINELLRRGAAIIYDLDLMGQAVSPTSTTYPEAQFGWMDDSVRLGYQLARVCVTGADGKRIWLAGFHHSGDTVSQACVQELITAAEAQTHVRPRRRTELVQQRINAQTQHLTRLQRLRQQRVAKVQNWGQMREGLIGQRYHAEQQLKIAGVSAKKKADLRGKLKKWRKRLPKLEAQIVRGQQVRDKHQTEVLEAQAHLAQLKTWCATLENDNRTNPQPPDYLETRMDAGFTSGENLTWVLEMGYGPNTKSPNSQTTQALRNQLSARPAWSQVGKNAEMVAFGEYHMHGCPYPLIVALERFKVGREFRYATLLRYRDDGRSRSLREWFQHYNARQTIEAGNKEMKGTFFVQHLMTHALPGIQLQVLFTGLAANSLRWSTPWLSDCSDQLTLKWQRTLNSPKNLVHVAANCAAWVEQTSNGTALQFAPESPFPGITLFLKGVPAFQLALGFNRPSKISNETTNRALVAQNLR
jgi:hypothetical protein